MPSVDDNRQTWNNAYDWPQGGEEWSFAWIDTAHLWHHTILPRLGSYLPVESVLEIAPGFGRMTNQLRNVCRRLVGVDLNEKCVEACRQRFAGARQDLQFFVNDGRSLAMVADQSVDLVFSWDSLVHVEHEVLAGYLEQLPRKMRKNAVGFIHHSNMAEYTDPVTGQPGLPNPGWRGRTADARQFAAAAEAAGLRCLCQEIFPWTALMYSDCLSLFVRADSDWPVAPNRVVHSMELEAEGMRLRYLDGLYNVQSPERKNPTTLDGSMMARVQRYRAITRNRPLMLWCASKEAMIVKQFLEEWQIKVAGFIDNNSQLAGKTYLGLPVAGPAILNERSGYNRPFVLVANAFYMDKIRPQLEAAGYVWGEDFEVAGCY